MSLEEQKAAAVFAALALEGKLNELGEDFQSKMITVLTLARDVTASIREITPPIRTVKDFGAVGDGVQDDTAAIQRAFNAGVYKIPAGTYMVNGDQTKCLNIKTPGVTLEMASDTILKVIPNALPRYYGLRVTASDVTVKGGMILGDRLVHNYVDTGTSTRTHEWGYGLMASGDRIKLQDLKVAQCTGDGIGVSGDDHEYRNITATQNRRQGLSAFTCRNLRVYDSEFSLTGAYLTDAAAPNGPCAGVDVEPDVASVVDVWFFRCKFNGNRAGFLAWLRSEVGGTLNCHLENCEMVGNANGVQGKALAGAVNIDVQTSSIVNNRGSGIRVEAGCTVTVNGNTFDQAGERTDFTLTGTDTRTKYDIAVYTGGKANVGTNTYV